MFSEQRRWDRLPSKIQREHWRPYWGEHWRTLANIGKHYILYISKQMLSDMTNDKCRCDVSIQRNACYCNCNWKDTKDKISSNLIDIWWFSWIKVRRIWDNKLWWHSSTMSVVGNIKGQLKACLDNIKRAKEGKQSEAISDKIFSNYFLFPMYSIL